MTQTWTMEARQPAKRISMNDRGNWRTGHKLTKAWKEHAWAMALRDRPPEITSLASVQIDFGVTDPQRRRDPHNMAPTQKAIVDGLTLARFWPDDDSIHVTVPEARYVKATIPTYRVTITWEEPDA